MSRRKITTGRRTGRYDQESWLQAALDVLASEGRAGLRIEDIAKQLGVTKGSFYHHFQSRADFVSKLSAYWAERYTNYVIQLAGKFPGRGADKLFEVMRLVQEQELDKYDIAFRSWAAQNSHVAVVVRQVDLSRYKFIRSLFEDMGFSGVDLETRTRAWLVYASAGRTVNFPVDDTSRGHDRNAVLEFFMRA